MSSRASIATLALSLGLAAAAAQAADPWPPPEQQWRYESQGLSNPVPYPSVPRIEGILMGEATDLVRLDTKGQEVWRTPLISLAKVAGQVQWARERIKAPVVVDLDGQGAPEIVAQASYGEVFALDGDGQVLWRWPGLGPVDFRMFVTAGDVDGDGRAEIVVPSKAGWVGCLDRQGRVLWQFSAGWEMAAAPVVADLDGDGREEVVYGSGSRVLALSGSGRLLWQTELSAHEAVFSRNRPLVMDGDGDGRAEVYILDCVRNLVVRLDGPTGAVAWVEPQPSYYGYLGLSAADLEGDGVFDLIVTGKSTLVARMSLSGGSTLWGTQLGGRGIFFAPAVADLNGDGVQEVVVGVRGHSPDERRTAWYVVDPSGEILAAVAQEDGGIHAPLVADLDRDGRLEVVSGERHLTAWEFPFEGGAIAAGHMWAGDERPSSLQEPSEARPAGEKGVLVRSFPPPHYGYNLLELDSPDTEPGDHVEVSVLGPSGVRWSRVHPVRAGDPPALRYPVRQLGRHHVEVRLLDEAGVVKSYQRRAVKVKDLLGPVARQVEAVVGQARQLAGELADRQPRAARFALHQAARLQGDLALLEARTKGVESFTWREHEALADQVRLLLKTVRRTAGLAELTGRQASARANTDLVVWEDPNPWDLVNPLDELPADLGSPVVEVWGYGNEVENRAVHVLNTSPAGLVVRLEPGSIAAADTSVELDREADEVVRFSQVVSLSSKHAYRVLGTETDERVPELLPELGPEKLLSVAPGEVEDLWLEVSTYGLASGEYTLKWPLTTLEPAPYRDTLTVRLRVSEVALPERAWERPYVFHPWTYPLHQGPERMRRLAVHLKRSGVNAAVLNLPYVHVDTTGTRLIKPLDWSAFDRMWETIGPLKHLLFQNYHIYWPEGVEPDEEQWLAAFGTYADAVFPRLDSLGIGADRFSVYPQDEPGLTGEGSVQTYIAKARRFVDSDPRWRVYSNYAGTTTAEQVERMAEVTHVWQPAMKVLKRLYEQAMPVMRRREGSPVWWFVAEGNGIVLDPLGFYRGSGWETFRLGVEGWGFWSLRMGPPLWKTRPEEEPDYVTIGDDGVHFTSDRRWQAVRDGTEDFTAFTMLAERAAETGDPEAEALLAELRPSSTFLLYRESPDWERVQEICRSVERTLVRLRP